LIKFWVNSDKRVGGSKVNLFVIWFDCRFLAVLCYHLATENVTKLLFLAFRYVAARGRGLLCLAPQLVLFLFFFRFSVYVIVVIIIIIIIIIIVISCLQVGLFAGKNLLQRFHRIITKRRIFHDALLRSDD